MDRQSSLRNLLPAVQSAIAVLFGGTGLWQRSAILSRPWFSEGQTMWDTTARFRVWPWPYKFAVVSNFPAFMAGALLSWNTHPFRGCAGGGTTFSLSLLTAHIRVQILLSSECV